MREGETILDRLAEHARERVRAARTQIPPEEIRRQALSLPIGGFSFEKALKKPGLSFICECKKASPSKGITEPKWFLGSGRYLEEIAETVSIPCLRKDFTVDEYMIYEAKILGASAVLLICSILSQRQLSEYLSLCEELGLSALVEAHDEAEVELAQRAGARIIGVNNRNLKDFSVDAKNSLSLRQRIPEGVLFVSESGVQSVEDVRRLREAGADAVLVGEALMRASDKKKKLAKLRGLV